MRRCLLALIIALFVMPSLARAERLPIRAYTTADGLAHNEINKIVRDSRGFLWFATNDGLSRFDGYAFSNYTVEHGLPHRRVRDLLETRNGELWVATFGGLVRFRPDGVPAERIAYANDGAATTPMFATVIPSDEDLRARAVTALLESRDGTIWCGTRKGLFRLDRTDGRFELRPVDLGIPGDVAENRYINDLLEDRHGSLWSATPSGLYRRRTDGTIARFSEREGLPSNFLHDLLADREGRIWVASRYSGFFRLDVAETAASPTVAEHYNHLNGLPTSWIFRLWEGSDGRFWATTSVGLVEFLPKPTNDGSRFVAYTRTHGLSHQEVTVLGEDAGGNLWIGTATSGLMKLVRNGFITYAQRDGLASACEVFEDSNADLYVHAAVLGRWADKPLGTVDADGDRIINRYGRFTGRGFEWFLPPHPYWPGSVPDGATAMSVTGDWWLAMSNGLSRYAALARFADIRAATPVKIYTTADGLPGPQVYRVFADSRGDVWFSIVSASKNGFFRWDRATQSLRDMRLVDGAPPVHDAPPRSFGEDAAGAIWIGLDSGLARYRDGRFTVFTPADGLPAGFIVDIHADAAGRLWLASSVGGLMMIENPVKGRPAFTQYTTREGLSGNSIEMVAEDLYGRIYVATGRGLDQLDPGTGAVKQFTADDGLVSGTMLAAMRDRSGAMWFGTQNGLSRFVPPAPERAAPPAILITGLTVAGVPHPVSAIGAVDLVLPDLLPDGNPLQIEFASLRFAPGDRVRYQYRLEGTGENWGPLTERRGVTFASLASGRYRFLVRAVNADGVASPQPAVVTFTVLPPVWMRWWFLTLAALAITAAALTLHRYRLARIIELERVRTHIATDLHDDVGANLTRIAILSEVARQQRPGGRDLDAPLSSIADIARESVATMSDIVWAISPERDTLRDMVRRMRDHSEDVFESRDIRVMLDMPDLSQPMRLGVDIRRDLYLIFKEAVNNAARHADCTSVAIELRTNDSHLSLEVTDNGAGFEPGESSEGNGLASMRRRAARLGGSLDVLSGRGLGTTVRLRMPVRESRVPGAVPTPKSR